MNSIVILVCSDFEWKFVLTVFNNVQLEQSPYGNWFFHNKFPPKNNKEVIWFKSGWGKIGSASATQYVIDTFAPDLILNIGSCGGFKGFIKQNEVVLINETIVYDMIDLIGKSGKSIEFYKTSIDYGWLKDETILKLPKAVMLTADQELNPERIADLHDKYNAVVGDWESGAIAWVAARNGTKLLILRGVSDVVGFDGNEAYGEDESAFLDCVNDIMRKLMDIVINFSNRIE
jgi:adenosylhomocysteine nucleosidase